jgi:hypothetical protein
MIRCEVVTHDGYGVPPDVFALFFETVAETIADLCGEDWSPAFAKAWREIVAEASDLAHSTAP